MFDILREDLRQACFYNHKGDTGVRAFFDHLLHPGTQTVLLYRFGQWTRRLRLPVVRHLLRLLYFLVKPFQEAVTGVVISSGATIGPGFVIHSGYGVYVGAVTIGRNVLIQHGVVLAYGTGPYGHDIYFGAGAKVVNGGRVGSRVRIGANAVVVDSIPDNCTAVGVPARVVRLRMPDGEVVRVAHEERGEFMMNLPAVHEG
ncbi:MAG: hypothetical protein AB1486_26895 [Planctomycetota bacterium]